MEQPGVRRLLRKIADTQDDEISCAECWDLLGQVVDSEVAGTVIEETRSRLS